MLLMLEIFMSYLSVKLTVSFDNFSAKDLKIIKAIDNSMPKKVNYCYTHNHNFI